MGLSNFLGNAGPSGMNFRGTWTPTPSNPATYNLRDGVRRASGTPPNGGTFLCVANGITSDPLVDNTSWVQIVADGATGPTGALQIGVSSTTAAAGNDARLMNPDPPVARGFIQETIRPREASTSNRPGTGIVSLTKMWMPSPATIANCYMYFGAAGSQTQTSFFMGLYGNTGTLLASSNNQVTAANAVSTGLFTCPLSAPYSWAGGANAYFYVAYLPIGGATEPGAQCTAANTNVVNVNVASGASQAYQQSGQASLPGSIVLTGLTPFTIAFWFAVA